MREGGLVARDADCVDIDILATASIGHQTVAATAKVWGHHNNAIALLRR